MKTSNYTVGLTRVRPNGDDLKAEDELDAVLYQGRKRVTRTLVLSCLEGNRSSANRDI